MNMKSDMTGVFVLIEFGNYYKSELEILDFCMSSLKNLTEKMLVMQIKLKRGVASVEIAL